MSQQFDDDYYTPQPTPAYYGYVPGNTYIINGYRMYLHGSYWYFVDYPQATPLKASRNYYRTGGKWGLVAKILGPIFFFTGVGLMMVDDPGALAAGALLATLGIFGSAIGIADSMRNHQTAWKVGATAAVTALAVHQMRKHTHGRED